MRTVLHIHRLLHKALRQAMLWQLRPTNPTDAVEAPRVVDKEMAALDEDGAAYADFAVRIGLTGIRFHDLRHSHASQLLRQRVSLTTIQERLGHVSATVTLNTYAHLLAGDDQLAVDNFELELRSAIEKLKPRRAK